MPPLRRPQGVRSVSLPPRTAAVAGECDVLVVGGGPAGLAAALGAAATGAEVILAERYGFLGGNATAALVMPLMSFHTHRGTPARADDLMPADHGPGEPVVHGVLGTLLQRLAAVGGAIPPSERTGFVVPFDPEILKLVALDLLDEAGVKYVFHALATGVLGAARLEGVVFDTKSGPIVIQARVTVDCTGDGDIAALAGAPFEVGRDRDELVQPMTLMFRMVEFERAAFADYCQAHPGQWRGVHGLWDLIREAAAAGELDLPREDILLFGTPHEREVSVNSTRVTGALGISVWDLTRAEWESRRQMRQISAFLRRYVPGFERAYVVQSGVGVGVRETRRIVGEYQLTADDVLGARKWDDAVARGTYPIDIHNPAGKGTILRRLPPGEAYDIPLRCLLPQRVEQLTVAGRCISGTHEAHSSYRVMPIAMATGHAAGVCAGLAARSGRTPRDVPASEVQEELRRQGADVGPARAPTGTPAHSSTAVSREGHSMAQNVRDVMTPNPVTIQSTASVLDAARVMRDHDIGDVIVLEGSGLAGILTDRDIVVRALAEVRDPALTQVGLICSRVLSTVLPTNSVGHAVQLMREKAIRRLPVVEESGKVVGIVSLGDVAIEKDPPSALAAISAAPPNV